MLDEPHSPRDAPPAELSVVRIRPAASADAVEGVAEFASGKEPDDDVSRASKDDHSGNSGRHDDF